MLSPGFVGRSSERDLLDGMLSSVRAGESKVLVIRGEAGIGKTALLRYAARQSSGLRVAELKAVEAEMELPFAGIHQLSATMLDRLDALPAPQRGALGVALGLAAGEAPERFLVGLAVLSLLAAVAEEATVVSRRGRAVAGRRLKPDLGACLSSSTGGIGRHRSCRAESPRQCTTSTASPSYVSKGCRSRMHARCEEHGQRPSRRPRTRPGCC